MKSLLQILLQFFTLKKIKRIWWHHYHAQKYKNGNEKVIVSKIFIFGIHGSIHIKVDIFFINKKHGDPITWFLIFFTIFWINIRWKIFIPVPNAFCDASSVEHAFLLADTIFCVFTYFKLCTQSYVNLSELC